MSVESWRDEFYPISARAMARRSDDPLVLTKHALQKWKGFLPENLEKHGIGPNDDLEVSADVSSCALCEAYMNIEPLCRDCPLYQLRDEKCYKAIEGSPAVYSSQINDYGRPRYPEITIKGLEDTILMLEKKNAAHSQNSEVPPSKCDQENSGVEQESSEDRRIPDLAFVYPD